MNTLMYFGPYDNPDDDYNESLETVELALASNVCPIRYSCPLLGRNEFANSPMSSPSLAAPSLPAAVASR
jgi:hypothetical protein